MMRSLLPRVAALAFVCTTAAHASSFDVFHLTGHGADLTFTLPDAPTPNSIDPGYAFGLKGIDFTNGGVLGTGATVYFYTPPISGGFSLLNASGKVVDNYMFYGAQLFSGSTAMPTFNLGNFTLLTAYCSPSSPAGQCIQDSYNLNVASAPTPEPGSLMLLGTGALAVAAGVRRRWMAV